jgi:hypothetical protein
LVLWFFVVPIRDIRVIRGSEVVWIFPRNLAPAFTHYLSERPEMNSQRGEVTDGQNNERKFNNMKNRNNQLTAILFLVALALGPIIQAAPKPDGGPTRPPGNSFTARRPANEAPRPDGGPFSFSANPRVTANSEAIPEGENQPVITVHSTDSVTRGKTGSFVLDMHPLMFGGMYVNFSLSGSAVAGVDYVQPLSPAYIGQSGYGAILIQTLFDPRASSSRQAYSVVVTLEAGAGYWLGQPSSATMWIKP